MHLRHLDAGKFRRLDVAADRIDVTAEGGEPDNRAEQDDGDEKENGGHRHDAPHHRAQDLEIFGRICSRVDRGDREILAASQPPDAERADHHRQRDDERLKASLDDEGAVNRSQRQREAWRRQEDPEDSELGRNLRGDEAGDRGAGRNAEQCGNAIAAPRPQRDLPASARVEIAPAFKTVEHEPRQEADRQCGCDRRRRPRHDRRGRPARLGQQHRANDRGTAHDRSDRQVDAAEQNDHRHSGGDQTGDRHLPQHVGQILVREEDVPARGGVWRGERADHADERQAPIEFRARQKSKRVHSGCSRHAFAHARRREAHDRFLGRRCARQNPGLPSFAHHQNPVGQQQQFRHFRAHGDDGQPARREIEDQLVDFLLRADIDATRRFVEQQHPWLHPEPLADHDLLLVAARQRGCDLLDVIAAHAKRLDHLGRQRGFAREVADGESRQRAD